MVFRSFLHTSLMLLACIVPFTVSAEIQISEIMYDAEGTDADREWVEIYNSGSEAVDLTGWKINDGSNHVLNEPPKNGGKGALSIAPGGYAILADDATSFLAEYSAGVVIDTVLELKNTGESITLFNGEGGSVAMVSYSNDLGGADDGNSLQKRGGSWIAASPTPGAANALEAAAPQKATESAPTEEAAKKSVPKKEAPPKAKPEEAAVIKIDAPDFVIAGDPATFRALLHTSAAIVNEEAIRWNFGDGTTGTGRQAEHAYDRPGTYVVVLTVTSAGDELVARATVAAELSPLEITQIEPGPDGFLILKNSGVKEVDITGWRLQAGEHSFQFPSGTIILPEAEVVISSRTTGLLIEDPGAHALLFPAGKLAAVFEVRQAEQAPRGNLAQDLAKPAAPALTEERKEPARVAQTVREANQSAPDAVSVHRADETPEATDLASAGASTSRGIVPWFATLAALLIVAIAATFFTRRPEPESVREEVDTYTIIDDE